MENNFLLDNWEKMGFSIEEFKETVKDVAKSTSFVKMNSQELSVLSFNKKNDNEEKLEFFEFNPVAVVRHNTEDAIATHRSVSINPQTILSKGSFETLIDEAINDAGILLYTGKRCMFVSKKAITTKLQPFGLSGDFLSENNYARDLMIAYQFGEKALFRTLVVREQNGIAKVFSILGERYRHLPQDILARIYDELTAAGIMGETECRGWQMSHFMTSVRVEFPEKADEFQSLYSLPDKLIPGIILETSDTGDCSIRVKGTWRFKNSTSLHTEVAKRHVGSLNIEELLKEVEDSVFAEYTKLPEALCNLVSCDVTDPSWDLTAASGQSKNGKAIESVLKSAFKKLKIVEAIGKQAEMSLYQQVLLEFDDSIAYTAYDFAMCLMSLPERVGGLHPLLQEKLEKAVSKAPYIDYKVTSKKSSPIVLSA